MSTARFEAALAEAGVTAQTLSQADRDALDRDGYLILRGVFDGAQSATLTETFEHLFVPSHQWPMPRGWDTRHAMLNEDLEVRRACLAAPLLAAAHHILKRRFYLADVQGRDPKPGGGLQKLHRDWVVPEGPAPMVIGLAFLDAFGAENGATRLLPGTHRESGGPDAYGDHGPDHPGQVIVEGEAGDVLIMDGYLVHGGTKNRAGRHRRNLQINFQAHELYGAGSTTLPQAPAALRYLFGED